MSANDLAVEVIPLLIETPMTVEQNYWCAIRRACSEHVETFENTVERLGSDAHDQAVLTEVELLIEFPVAIKYLDGGEIRNSGALNVDAFECMRSNESRISLTCDK